MDEKHFERGFDTPQTFSPETLAKLAYDLLPTPAFIQTLVLSFLSLLACLHAHATSFGPLPLTAQMQEATYVYQGKIRGRWVELEKNSQKPYTHWNLVEVEVLKSPNGENLRELILRQPGGEMGQLGYRVSGSAEFSEGEEVVVMAKATDIPNVREVMGLAGGKYAVETAANGKKILRNGIGFTATNASGEPLSVEAFTEILNRVKRGATTDEDRRIIFNASNPQQHGHSHSFPDRSSSVRNSSAPSPSIGKSSPQTSPFPVQKAESAPDKSTSGLEEERSSILVIVAVALAAFVAGIFWIVFRRK